MSENSVRPGCDAVSIVDICKHFGTSCCVHFEDTSLCFDFPEDVDSNFVQN